MSRCRRRTEPGSTLPPFERRTPCRRARQIASLTSGRRAIVRAGSPTRTRTCSRVQTCICVAALVGSCSRLCRWSASGGMTYRKGTGVAPLPARSWSRVAEWSRRAMNAGLKSARSSGDRANSGVAVTAATIRPPRHLGRRAPRRAGVGAGRSTADANRFVNGPPTCEATRSPRTRQ